MDIKKASHIGRTQTSEVFKSLPTKPKHVKVAIETKLAHETEEELPPAPLKLVRETSSIPESPKKKKSIIKNFRKIIK